MIWTFLLATLTLQWTGTVGLWMNMVIYLRHTRLVELFKVPHTWPSSVSNTKRMTMFHGTYQLAFGGMVPR